jgi:hypothetical protein
MIIGLCGFQGAGKDTVGDILVKNHGFIKISFGSALKDAVASLFGWDRVMLEGSTPESRTWRETVDEFWSGKLDISGFTPRKALQMIGTDVLRKHFSPNMWVDIVENKINKLIQSNPSTNIVVTDCRFTNELSMVKKFTNSQILYVQRNEPEWFEQFRFGDRSIDLSTFHPSEIEWMSFHFDKIINNDGHIDKLELDILKLCENKHMDFSSFVSCTSCPAASQLKYILETNMDWDSYYKVRIFVTKFSQVMGRLTGSKIPDEKIGYYKNLVYKDWVSNNRLSQFNPKYHTYICAILNALKNKKIKGRVNFS